MDDGPEKTLANLTFNAGDILPLGRMPLSRAQLMVLEGSMDESNLILAKTSMIKLLSPYKPFKTTI